MKNKNTLISIVVAIIVVALIAWGLYSSREESSMVDDSETGTTTPNTATTTGSAANPLSFENAATGGNSQLKVTNVTEVRTPVAPLYKTHTDTRLGYSLKYPAGWTVVTPSQTATPLLFRGDREFAFCDQQYKTASGACTPAFTIAIPGKGHGVSVYVLNHTATRAEFPQIQPYQRVHVATNRLYEIVYSDTVSIQSTPEENLARQDAMAIMLNSFLLQ
jgi:hypothetical protein